MKLVINAGIVFATHTDDQDILGLYPGMEILSVTNVTGAGIDGQGADPRTLTGVYTLDDVRANRNRLLAESDKADLAGFRSTLTAQQQTDYDTYRNALRALPEEPGVQANPSSVIWPTKPA